MKLPYIIAEIGLNHEGSASRAADMIWEAAQAGANAAKFQAVRADRLVSKSAPAYFHQEGKQARTQHEFFDRVRPFTEAEWGYMKWSCDRNGIDFLCTVFDVESVHWVAPLVPAFKVASADITNIPLLKAIRSAALEDYDKPKSIYISTGAATRDEVDRAWGFFHRTPNVTWLHCVLSYPTPTSDANLGVMQGLPAPYGYSDHTLFNLDVLTTAWLLGATVIEKHFTLDKSLPGNDHYHSMDPADLRTLVAKFKELQAMIGDGEKRVLPIEGAARLNARQSWHAVRDLPVGHVIQEGDAVLKRPGTGLPASERIVGRIIYGQAVQADEPLRENALILPEGACAV